MIDEFRRAPRRKVSENILVTDAMKLHRTAPIRIGHISQIATIVTDLPLPHSLEEICTAGGVEIVVASP